MAQGKLKKSLNLLDLTFLGVGSIIGSGWLYAAQTGAQLAGPGAWISWLIGAFVVILIGLVYAELGAAMPRAGGFVRYPDYTHGSVVGFMLGFASMLAYSSVVGIEVIAVRGYAAYWWPALQHADGTPTLLGFGLQLFLLVLFLLLNYWSVNIFGKSNTFITIFKFAVPSLIIIFLLFHLDVSNLSVGGADPGGLKGIFSAVTGAGIVFSFLGFRQAIDFAGEARNPQKDVPRAIIYAILIGLGIYLLLQFAFLGSVPSDMLANGGWVSIQFDSPWAGLAATFGAAWLVNLVLIDAVVSPSGTGNIYLSGTARVMFAWAKNGYFYSIFQKVDKRTGLPRAALWLTFVLGFLWTLPAQFQVWSGLVSACTSAFVITYMVGPVSLTSLREKRPDMERPFKLKMLSIVSPLAFIASTLVVYWSGWDVISLLVALTVGSLILFFAFVDKVDEFRKNLRADMKAAYWLFGYYLWALIISFLGSYGPLDQPVIPAPWDNVVLAVGSLGLYYWGVRSALPEPRIKHEDE